MKLLKTKKIMLAISVIPAILIADDSFAEQKALEEVIVSARKRDENLQEVPAAVNVMSADQLQSKQVVSMVDLERTTPNVTFAEAGASASGNLLVYIRGMGNDAGFDPGVGLYIDDVFLQRATGSLIDLYDVERIEVLKGPQGSLYGRNTLAGAIKYVTREPNETAAANIEAKIGKFNLRQLKASVSGPLVDDLLFGGVAIMDKRRDGIQTNTYNGEKLWSAEVQGIRGSLKLTPTESLVLKSGLEYTHDNSKPRISSLIAANTPLLLTRQSSNLAQTSMYDRALRLGALPPGAPPPDFSGIGAGPDSVASDISYDAARLLTFTAYLSVLWTIDDQWELKSTTAERKVKSTGSSNLDGSSTDFIINSTAEQITNSDDWTQEFQVNYSGEKIDAVGGLFYINSRQDTPSHTFVTPYFTSLFDLSTDTSKSSTDLDSVSLYGNVDYAITDDWHLSVGARETQDKKTYHYMSSSAYYGTAPALPQILAAQGLTSGTNEFGPDSKTWRNFSPSLKLAYNINSDTLAYVSFSSGFKSGGYNPVPSANSNSVKPTYDPEKVKTYALGLKTTLFDGRLRFNNEIFYNDYTDKQINYFTTVPPSTSPTFLYANAGKVMTSGVESEISWLTPMEGLMLNLNIGYLSTHIDSLEKVIAGISTDQAASSRLGNSPRWTVQPQLNYSLPLADYGKLNFAVDASYRAKSYTNLVNTSDASGLSQTQVQDEHAVFNSTLAFTTADEHWRFVLEGKNLTNRRVLVNTFVVESTESIFTNGVYNDPKTWALSAAYKY